MYNIKQEVMKINRKTLQTQNNLPLVNKRVVAESFILLAICLIGTACKKNESKVNELTKDIENVELSMNAYCATCNCENVDITKILKNELVTICFSQFPVQSLGVDSLFFLEDKEYAPTSFYPCYGQVPLEYREAGLKVRISGYVTNCSVSVYAPHVRLFPSYIFELTSIRKEEEQ